jgi:hypothetical protein
MAPVWPLQINTNSPYLSILLSKSTRGHLKREGRTPIPCGGFLNPKRPGSRGPLPAPSPLRPVHDSFPSHGSSPSKANLCIKETRRLRISIAFAIHVGSQSPFRWRAHRSPKGPHLLSLLRLVPPAFSQRSTCQISAPLRIEYC